jgi:hypothetical protein
MGPEKLVPCRKLSTASQMPYAYFEACVVCLWGCMMSVAFMAAFWIHHPVLCVFVTFVTVWGFAVLHEIANSMEEPFRFYPDVMHLDEKQININERLIAVSSTRRPLGFADFLRDIHNHVPYESSKQVCPLNT